MQEVFPRREVGLKVKELKLVFQIEVSKLYELVPRSRKYQRS